MKRVIVVQPGGGEVLSSGTSLRHVKVEIESLHLTEYSVETAPMGDLHTHERHADAFYVLEGELEVAVSETETEIVAVSERGEKPSRELFERFDMHVRQ